MSRNAAAIAPGRANRRFILLAITLGLLGAVLVYVAFSRQGTSAPVKGSGGAAAPIVVAKVDIPARTKITQAMLDVRLVPAESRSALGFSDMTDVVGQVTRFPISANEQILSEKVVSLAPGAAAIGRSLSFVVPPGKRGFAINTSAVQDAGGLVLPGDYVDVLILYDVDFATKANDPTSKQKANSFLVQTVFQNIEVLAVSQTIVDTVPQATPDDNGQIARNSEARPQPDAGTVTLALTPEQAQKMYLAESNGKIRLSVRPYGEGGDKSVDFSTQPELVPPNLPNPFLR